VSDVNSPDYANRDEGGGKSKISFLVARCQSIFYLLLDE